MHSRFLTLLFFLHMPLVLLAQSNYQPGYMVPLQGDTVKGLIDYKEWSRNPSDFSFKSLADPSTIQKFNASQIRSFRIDGLDAYECFTVWISMDESNLSSLPQHIDTSKIQNTIFLKVLLKGDKISLYSFRDAIKTRFYVLEGKTAIPLELGYKQYRNASQVITLTAYKQQLINLANQYNALTPSLKRLIEGATYTKSDLLAITRRINQINEAKVDTILEKKQKSRFFLSAGLRYTSAVYRGNNSITYDRVQYGYKVYKDHVTTHCSLPSVSAGIDWFVNPAVQRLIFRAELSAFMLKSETFNVEQYDYPDEEVTYRYKLSAMGISVAPQVLYTIYNRENFRWYLGAGVAATFWHFNQHTLERKPDNPDSKYYEASFDDFFTMKDYSMNVVGRSGVMISKKIDISLLYLTPANLTNHGYGEAPSVQVSSWQLSVGYVLNRKK